MFANQLLQLPTSDSLKFYRTVCYSVRQLRRQSLTVRDVLSKVQEAYEKLIEKHEGFTKLIEGEKEFEEQEAWLEESQYMFLRLETDTKLYLESTEALPKERRVEDSYRNDIGSVAQWSGRLP